MRQRLATIALDKGGLVALAALLIYGLLAPHWIVGGDNAEFAGLSALGGIAHPPGYPLYVLWLRAFSWLPGASAAHTAALATALLAALQILVLHAACRAWGARPAAATAAVALYAASPVALLMHSQAETFAMNGLVGALVLWLAAPAGPVTGARRAILLALVAGLGLSDHPSCVLLAPVGIYGVVIGLRESTRRLRVGALGVAAFLVGLLPYTYAFVAPDSALSWGAIRDVGDLVHHILRRDYGTGSLTPRGGDARPVVGVTSLLFTLGRAWWWAGLVLGLGMLGHAAVKGALRWAWRALGASFLLAGPIFVARFNLGPADVDAWIAERFHLLPALVLAVPVAVAIDRIATRVRAPLSRPVLAHVVALALLPAAAAPSLAKVAAGHSRAVDREIANLLDTLPPDAVVVTAGDDLFFGMAYAQAIDGRRPDVVAINWGTMGFPWYQERISAQLGAPALPSGQGVASVRMAAGILARNRPLFIDAEQRNIAAAFPGYPYGALIRILPPGAEMPSLDEVAAENREVYERYDLRYPRPSVDDGWSAMAHHRYTRGWLTLAEAFERMGRPEDAAAARAAADAIRPR